MTYDPNVHHRRSIRLRDYDYSRVGAYFVTICAQNRECIFGEIINGETHLNRFGEIAAHCWNDLPNHYLNVELNSFVVMPNHIHGIILLTNNNRGVVGAGFKPAPTLPLNQFTEYPLSEIVRGFKTFSARRINELKNTKGKSVWQRNYYEHIIRNDHAFRKIQDYILNNPKLWEADRLHPSSNWKRNES